MNPPELAIIIPAWHERENLETLLPSLREVVSNIGLTVETVVVDGGSEDGSREVAESMGARFVLQEVRGYGGALLAGFASTTAPYLVTMDADLSHPPIFVSDLWKQRNQAEVVIASRYVDGGCAEMTIARRVLSGILNKSFGTILSLPVRDLSSGFRLYRREAIDGLTLTARDFDILEEILVRIYVRGGRVLEVPFSYMPRGSGNSHARLFKFGLAFLRTLNRMHQLRNGSDSERAIQLSHSQDEGDAATPIAAEPPISKAVGQSGR